MARNPRFDILFEPVKIGPVTAPNRFYQVPHASGMTNALPRVRAAFRETKAEGGWGVICTGACSIDPTSDDTPLPFATMWDDNDVRAHALMTEAVHRHGALAGVELWHGGASVMNRRAARRPYRLRASRGWRRTSASWATSSRRPWTRAILCRAQVASGRGRRARSAGFDIVYVYAGMGYLGYEFLLPEYNQRTDAYGGTIEESCALRARNDRGDQGCGRQGCGVALRIGPEELRAQAWSQRAIRSA